jgi:excisionase family DNA binding protein
MLTREAERIYTVEEVAERLRVNPETIRRYLRSGKLGSYFVAQAYRIPEAELERFMQEHWREAKE